MTVEPLLAPIRTRLEAATPGPWEHDEEGFMGCGQVYTSNPDLYGANIAAPSGDLYPRSGYSPKDDMVFIAAAPEDIGKLLAAVNAVLALADKWQAHFPYKASEVRAAVRAALEAKS